jgi:hypothetical protein
VILLIFRQVLVARWLSFRPGQKKPFQIRIFARFPIAGQVFPFAQKRLPAGREFR